jgi:DNA-binding XRE family transcriptional regulator
MSNHPLTAVRKDRDVTLGALAASVKTSKASLSRIEAGKQTPSMRLVERIVKWAGGKLSADDFMHSGGRGARR